MASSLVNFSAASMDGLEIKRIERVENRELWVRYQHYHYRVAKRMDSLPCRPATLSQRAAVATILNAAGTIDCGSENNESEDTIPQELRSRVICDDTSEFWLFHGTKPSLVDAVTTHGLDPRRSSLSGLYGAGSYFADSASKSHQYSKDEDKDGCRCMLLCRVTMGDTFLTNRTHRSERLPPENLFVPGRPYDSIFAETGEKRTGMVATALQTHNEYVVFDQDASYPEYIIHYTVGTKGTKEDSAPIPASPAQLPQPKQPQTATGCHSKQSPPPPLAPVDVQKFLQSRGLGWWVPYFATHLPNQVQSVALVQSITAAHLHEVGLKAGVRVDSKTIDFVLRSLK